MSVSTPRRSTHVSLPSGVVEAGPGTYTNVPSARDHGVHGAVGGGHDVIDHGHRRAKGLESLQIEPDGAQSASCRKNEMAASRPLLLFAPTSPGT